MSEETGLEMRYFILKPKGDDAYAAASRKAMRAYASIISEENPVLAEQLRDWAMRESKASWSDPNEASN